MSVADRPNDALPGRRVTGRRNRYGWLSDLPLFGIAVIAAVHVALYLLMWGSLFAQQDFVGASKQDQVSRGLVVGTAVLGFPVMHMPDRWFRALQSVVGDPWTLVVGASLNAVLWGCVLLSAWRALRGKH
jgi:hypothetical protein